MSDQLSLALRLTRKDFELQLSVSLPARGITVLLGPSGCGKTTTLRCIAGLERAAGRICIGQRIWQDDATGIFVPPWQRRLGYVFQDAGMLPHLSVQDNLLYGLKRLRNPSGRPLDPSTHATTLQTAIELLGIGHLLARKPETLSGGEQQRVAIARALALKPDVMLLDEPLASIDPARRNDILPWLENLRDELNIPTVYVTHSIDELMRLADHVVLMEQGQAIQQGPLNDALSNPDIARRFGEQAGVILQGRLAWTDTTYQLSRLTVAGGELWVRSMPNQPGALPSPADSPLRIRILARDVSLSLDPQGSSSIQNRLQGVVKHISDDVHPSQVLVTIQCGGDDLLARITRRAVAQLPIQPGQTVWCQIKSAAVIN